jgi:hypothetical protein
MKNQTSVYLGHFTPILAFPHRGGRDFSLPFAGGTKTSVVAYPSAVKPPHPLARQGVTPTLI